MPTPNYQLYPYHQNLRDQLLQAWERSVRATHTFLKPDDFDKIKSIVITIDFYALNVQCLMHGQTLAGFLGVAENKLEMLFLDPAYFGQGLGKKMLLAALDLGVTEVEVNEQNNDAVHFYQHFGFEIFDRTELDSLGLPYPILKMRLMD
jgi:putative acetyltransferase